MPGSRCMTRSWRHRRGATRSLKLQIDEAATNIKLAHEKLGKRQWGCNGDTLWSSEVPDDASFADLYKRAEATVLTQKGKETSKLAEDLKNNISRRIDLQELYQVAVDIDSWEQWAKDAVRSYHAASSVVLSGMLLLIMKTHHSQPFKLKKLVRAQVNIADALWMGQKPREYFHPVLERAIGEVDSVQFAWGSGL